MTENRAETVGCPNGENDNHRPAAHLSGKQRVRELVVQAAALGLRIAAPVLRRWRATCWSGALHSCARRVGPQVHVYGPVHFLGTQNVWLGGWGNIYDNVLFETVDAGVIKLGDGFRINRGALLSAHVAITAGDNCLIAEYVSIRDSNHVFDDTAKPISDQGFRAAPISIGDDVWIGRGSVILQGVTIGTGSVIAANSVVTKDVPSMEVWAGVPARCLRRRGATDAP